LEFSISNNSNAKECCTNADRFYVHFPNEPLIVYCDKHFVFENLKDDADLIYDSKLKKQVRLPNKIEMVGIFPNPSTTRTLTHPTDLRMND